MSFDRSILRFPSETHFSHYHHVQSHCYPHTAYCPFGRAETERDGTRAETKFGFPAKRTSPFISAGVLVQSAAGSRGVRINGSNAG